MATANMFTGASNVAISGGTFINQANSGKSGLERLSAAAAHSALHDAPARTDGTRCLQDTRTNVLNRLERWAQGILDEDASIFWLHGGAGAGKSAVMQTLAERFAAQGLALGSFFFSRDDKTRNSAEVLIPTLVYQLAQLFPSTLEILNPIIDRDPLIFNKNLQVQLLNLFVEPLKHLTQLRSISNASQSPRVFLIDGLDECSSPIQQQAIIQAAAAVCHNHRIPVKFLVASRPEQAISTSFGLYTAENHILSDISLSDDPRAPSDIRNFLEAEFLKIRLQHPFKNMLPSEWPDQDHIDTLVKKSSFHFIYASTVMKYFWSAKENPVRSLHVVLGLEVSRTTSPFVELDMLYGHILRSAAHLDSSLQLLGFCLYAALPPSIPLVSFMMDCTEDDLHIYLAEITPLVALAWPPRSFIWSTKERSEAKQVKLLHASLGDFLGDASRSGLLYINKEAYLASKLNKCFQLMAIHPKKKLLGLPSDYLLPYSATKGYKLQLDRQVRQTISEAGSLVVTQQVLGQCGLLKYLEWLPFRHKTQDMLEPELLGDFVDFFLAVHSIKTSDGVTVLQSSATDFLNILDTHIGLRKNRLVAAIFRLRFSGYSADGLRLLHATCFVEPLPAMSEFTFHSSIVHQSSRSARILEKISAAQITSIQHDLGTSSGLLLETAAEGILWHLFNHSVWAMAEAVGKYSVDVLLWLLPKVAVSEKISAYSKRAIFLRNRYSGEYTKYFNCIADCLDEYNTRVLEERDRRIENGDVNALIEKSRMLLINDQD